ncbi:MAG: hypothetical protein AAGH17_00875 [Pseudomonadota bacterium]
MATIPVQSSAQGLSGTQLTFGATTAQVGDNSSTTVELRGASAGHFGRGVSLQFDWGFIGNDDTVGSVSDTDGFKSLRLLTAWDINTALTLAASASYIKIEREETDSLALHMLWHTNTTRVEAIAEAFEAPTERATYFGTSAITQLPTGPDIQLFARFDRIDGAGLDRDSAALGLRHAHSPKVGLSTAITHDDLSGQTSEVRLGVDYTLSTGRTARAFVAAGDDSASAGFTLRYAIGGTRTEPLFDLSLFSAAFR